MKVYLLHAEYLRYMKDSFWKGILELKNYGKFSFVENAIIQSKEMRHLRNNSSTIFKILRNYILSEIEYINTNPKPIYNDTDLGWLLIKWDFNTDWDWAIILEELCKSFKILYKLNYQLWKIHDSKS